MKLRYLHIKDRPPLQDVDLTFKQSDVLPNRVCAIHFIVGVNGSGKSRLLQALAEVFLCLEVPKLPAFPVTLAYDLGHPDSKKSTACTIYLHHPGPDHPDSEAMLIEFEQVLPREGVDWAKLADADWKNDPPYRMRRHFMGDNLPGSGTIVSFLPSVLLAYTSGAEAPWREVFQPRLNPEIDVNKGDERPPHWTQGEEARYQFQLAYQEERQRRLQGDTRVGAALEESRPDLFSAEGEDRVTRTIGTLVTEDALKLAVCAVALQIVKTTIAKIRKEIRRRKRPLSEVELCEQLREWADNAKAEFRLRPFAVLERHYLQRAANRDPHTFDELWASATGVDSLKAE